MTIRVEAVILCDDVRQEISGKHILIGVYSGGIVVARLPVNFSPSWWIQFWGEKGKYTFDFRIKGPGGAHLASGKGEMAIGHDGLGAVVIPRLQIQLPSKGILEFEWRLLGTDQWETIKKFDVSIGGPTSAPTSPQPTSQSQLVVPKH